LNPIFFEGVAEHGNVGIGTWVLVLVVLLRLGQRSARRSTWSTESGRAAGIVAIFVFTAAKLACADCFSFCAYNGWVGPLSSKTANASEKSDQRA
jgi:hypothetical protein